MTIAFILLLVLHGAIHLLGFVKAFALAEIAQLNLPISRPVGALWLFAAAAFLVTAALVVAGSRWWWTALLPAVLVSQAIIVMSWSDAKLGTIPNAIFLLPLAVALLDLRSDSSRSIYHREVARELSRGVLEEVVTETELATLPPPVRRYLLRAGVVGRPHVHNLRARFRGQMRSARDKGWMTISVEQHNFFDEPVRLFFMDASLHGIPFDAFHAYTGANASMRVKIASLIDVIDASGKEMHRSETVTFFNDMCFLAPATLVTPNITWKQLDERTVRGTLSQAGESISADLTFDEEGDLVGFVSNDRLQSADGKTYKSFPWSTPLRKYRDFGAARLASYGEAIWIEPEGEYVYGRFEVESIEYNVAGGH